MDASQTPVKNVSDTAFWVAHYRAVESEKPNPLFRDTLAKRLVGEHGKRIAESMKLISAHTQYNVLMRTVIIDRYIEQLVQSGVDCIVNLGAGLDTRPYRMKLPTSLQWIEIDQKSIIEFKSKALSDEKPSCQLERIAIDASSRKERTDILDRICAHGKKVVVLTEGVLPYLTEEQVSELAEDLMNRKQIHFWICDYLSPKVYKYIQSGMRSQKMKNAPFQFFPPDWFGFFSSRGWIPHQVQYMAEEGFKLGRRPPAPWWIPLISWSFPKETKDQFMRASGYMILQKA